METLKAVRKLEQGITVSVESELPSLIEGDADPFLNVENGSTELYLVRHADALPVSYWQGNLWRYFRLSYIIVKMSTTAFLFILSYFSKKADEGLTN